MGESLSNRIKGRWDYFSQLLAGLEDCTAYNLAKFRRHEPLTSACKRQAMTEAQDGAELNIAGCTVRLTDASCDGYLRLAVMV